MNCKLTFKITIIKTSSTFAPCFENNWERRGTQTFIWTWQFSIIQFHTEQYSNTENREKKSVFRTWQWLNLFYSFYILRWK